MYYMEYYMEVTIEIVPKPSRRPWLETTVRPAWTAELTAKHPQRGGFAAAFGC